MRFGKILGTTSVVRSIQNPQDAVQCKIHRPLFLTSCKSSFCKEYSETILHLFVQCKDVRKFWSELKTHFQLILGIDLAINPSTLILGNLLTKTNVIPLNTIYLAAKLYIFRVSKSSQILNYPSFCSFLKRIYLEQEYTAKLEFKEGNCIPDAKRGYYGFIIVVVRIRALVRVRVRRDFLLATYSPHFFPDFFHIWQVT